MKNKKILTISLILFLLTSCGNKKNQSITGEDFAKVLLANERLDENQLRNEGNLFDSGKKAFAQIKNAIRKYSKNTKNTEIKPAFNKEGNMYTWSAAPEYSNFLDYFYSYANGIEQNAEKGCDLIELAKSSVEIVDSWIKLSKNHQILLTVDKNSETIFSRYDDQYEICKRSQNSSGQNVFEMFIANSETNAKSRMTYIPGIKYEFTSLQDDMTLVIVANKDKGYWDIMSTTYDSQYDQNSITFSNFVMKDEAIYETSYSIMEENGKTSEYYGSIKLISSDGKNDLLSIDGSYINIYTTGINGLECFYIEANDNEVGSALDYDNNENYKVLYVGNENDKQYFTNSNGEAIARFTNGMELKKDDTFNNSEIRVNGNMVNPIGDIDFYGQIELSFANDDISYMLNGLSQVMEMCGFTFKDSFEVLRDAIIFAKNDNESFGKYYLWQGYHVNSMENIYKAIAIEHNLINDFVKLYENYKNKSVVKVNKQLEVEEEYEFSNLNIVSNGTISNIENEINIEDITLKVLDSSLFVNNSNYQISFAFAKENDNSYFDLYILDFDNPITKKFDESSLENNSAIKDRFTLTQSATLKIPTLDEGNYVLVAFISTVNDGIRMTNPISISGNITEVSIEGNGSTSTLANNQENKICLNSTKSATIMLNLEGNYEYNELYLLLESYAYMNGQFGGYNLEKEKLSNWNIVEESTLIEKGTYRLKYYNSNLQMDGYIIATIN